MNTPDPSLYKDGIFPHCDPRVLHEPSICEYCDLSPAAQGDRISKGINFTGRQEPGLKPCPSDAARGVGGAGRAWGGNRPNGAIFDFSDDQERNDEEEEP